MRLLSYLRSIAAKFLHRSETEKNMDEELNSHVQHRADDLERSGMNRIDAERRARVEFGGHLRFRENSQESMGGNVFEVLVQDARFSLRVLRKSPGFTLVAVITLALAIGANAVVFGVLNSFLLRPLGVPNEQSLYAVWRPKANSAYESYLDYKDLRERNHSFEDLVGYSIVQAGLDTGAGDPTPSWIYEVSANYFAALGIKAQLGRTFSPSDEHGPNSAPYIVLAYAYWHTHFQDDPGVIGRIVQVNKHPFTILGVAPPEFHGTLVFAYPDFYVPITNQELIEGTSNLDTRKIRSIFMVMGHLKPGVTNSQAIADLNSIGAYLERTYPLEDSNLTFTLAKPGLYGDYLGGPLKAFLSALMMLAGLILVAACANLGSLFAARAADRGREVALRLALGASRSRILRQLFTEALMISLVGGTLGVLSGVVMLRALGSWHPFPRFPLSFPVNPDASVYVVALLLTLVSGFLFGAAPVRQVLNTNPYEVIKSGSTGGAGKRLTIRDFLLAGQIAICAVLVTSSMVAVRGLVRALHSNFGFQSEHVMLAETNLTMGGYSKDNVPAMQKRMLDSLEALPGVESVALVDPPPLYGGPKATAVFTDETADLRPGNAAARPYLFVVSPDYFRTAGTALLAGRSVTWHDDKNSPPVAIINKEFANRIFGSVTGAIGGHFKTPDGARIEVVGIAEDGKYETLTEEPQPAVFLPELQSPSVETWLMVRSNRNPQGLGPDVRNVLRKLDAALPFSVETWDSELNFPFFAPRMATMSLGVMGIIGAMLSITGIFGMAAYSVSKRLRELGIRMALGAKPKQVLQAALGRPFRILAFGSATGLGLGILANSVLSKIVYHATVRDPLVLGCVVLAMSLLGLVATWIPAHRALSVDPMKLLREE